MHGTLAICRLRHFEPITDSGEAATLDQSPNGRHRLPRRPAIHGLGTPVGPRRHVSDLPLKMPALAGGFRASPQRARIFLSTGEAPPCSALKPKRPSLTSCRGGCCHDIHPSIRSVDVLGPRHDRRHSLGLQCLALPCKTNRAGKLRGAHAMRRHMLPHRMPVIAARRFMSGKFMGGLTAGRAATPA
jgi:hypothetical protein